MSMSGISKNQVSRLRDEIDGKVKVFLERSIEGDWPYLWIDTTYLKVRRGGRIASVAVIIAVGVNSDGRREVSGMQIGTSEAEPTWTEFLRKSTRRGLRGVKLGIKAAVNKVLCATWQRCRVHFMRNALAHAGQSGRRVVLPSLAPPSPRRQREPPAPNGAPLPIESAPRCPNSLPSCTRSSRTSWPTWASLRSIERSSTAQTRLNASTARSGDAPMWSASSPTRRP
jgi:putative transposase